MSTYDQKTHEWEAAFSDALTFVACGETRDYAFDALLSYEALEAVEISDILGEALHEALKQDVQREDIDESWF